MVELAIGVVGAVVSLWAGSLEMRLRNMSNKIDKKASSEEVDYKIDVKQEALRVMQRELKEDLSRIERKIDDLNTKK